MLRREYKPAKNRRDHYLPVGYLKGFIDPQRATRNRPLWCWEIDKQAWTEKSPKQVGYELGFYDFAIEPVDAEHADMTFKHLEDEFPALRDELTKMHFENWSAHLPFLCRYMQMIRARSPLYFLEKKAELRTKKIHTITNVSPMENNQQKITLDSMEGRAMTAEELHNHTLSQMRAEIKRGVDWMGEFHWSLRTTSNPEDPVTTGEQPLTARADWNMPDPLKRIDTYIFFPLCWQACLVGNRLPFQSDREAFAQDKLRAYRRLVMDGAKAFVVSPKKLDE